MGTTTRHPTAALAIVLGLVAAAPQTPAFDLESVEQRVTVETLDNGLTVLVYERPTAPVVSFATHVDVGSAQEVAGITGLAQVNQGYDTCLDDVRTKLGFDLQYSLALSSPRKWISMDLHIVVKTIATMVLGRGQ